MRRRHLLSLGRTVWGVLIPRWGTTPAVLLIARLRAGTLNLDSDSLIEETWGMGREIDRRPPWTGRDRYVLTAEEQKRALLTEAEIAAKAHSRDVVGAAEAAYRLNRDLPGDPPKRRR
jgi:hypothetical protein